MKPRLIHLYVAAVGAGALLAVRLIPWTELSRLEIEHLPGLIALLVLAVVSESLAISFNVVGGRSSHSSITFLPLLTSVLLFGPAATAVLMGVTELFHETVVRKKPLLRVLFNIAQWILAIAVGSWCYYQLGGVPLTEIPDAGATHIRTQIAPFAVFALSFWLVNHTAVALAIAISEGMPVREVLTTIGALSGGLVYDILVSPIAVAVSFLYLEMHVVGILLALLPLLFIRRAYLTNFKLQQANRDLLTALVKAIETRDPYTSGHSLRVAALAKRIAVNLGVSRSRLAAIETAALLHDIGKIDRGYVDILQKPTSLSAEERRVIESHVVKGVELLTSLSSLPTDVIAAVRHHHEREDGRGYPDRLSGDEIPLGAKIIKVCDAIDAMLSDRPYRSALSLAQVREQLTIYAGIQFDARIVRSIVGSDILERHQQDVLRSAGEPQQLRGASPARRTKRATVPSSTAAS